MISYKSTAVHVLLRCPKSVLVGQTRLIYYLPVSWETGWNVLKWVLAALAAGFIGQFGKSFALHLIRKRRRANEPSGQEPTAPVRSEIPLEKARLDAEAKIEKKRAKAEVKRLKKL